MALLLTHLEKPCLIIGHNLAALAMIENLLRENIAVKCIAENVDENLVSEYANLNVVYEQRPYTSALLNGISCVMCFTDKSTLIDQVVNDSAERAIPLYVDGDATRSSLGYSSSLDYRNTNVVIVDNREQAQSTMGEVYLVGAGPGDPDLLTIKALKLMQQADVVLYDRLVSQPIIELVNHKAEKIYVGKRRQDHALPQMAINQKLVELAQAGRKVLRLKGGDPFIFGRGGEEIDLLSEHNIEFQVVPGITAASGCSAYSGIPLTHRDYAQSVRFITGHTKTDQVNLNWHHFSDSSETLVFYMGLVHLEQICQKLIGSGRSATTPAALIEKGTTDQQRMVAATLSDLPSLVRQAQLKAPTLLIIGDVVKLHKKLNWFVHE